MLVNILGTEVWVLLLIALVLFGGKRLPELARGLGRSVNEFKRGMAGIEEEISKPAAPDVRQVEPEKKIEPPKQS